MSFDSRPCATFHSSNDRFINGSRGLLRAHFHMPLYRKKPLFCIHPPRRRRSRRRSGRREHERRPHIPAVWAISVVEFPIALNVEVSLQIAHRNDEADLRPDGDYSYGALPMPSLLPQLICSQSSPIKGVA
jgi:hypothetical protein